MDPMMGGADAGMDPSMGGDPNAMGDPMMGGADAGMDPNAMGGDPNAMGNENYGADFDAGVDANEEEDPKKFNQQLTGKLSQSLQKYEDGLGGQPDDLPKYVGGMILAQIAKYMQPEEFDKMVADAKEGMQPTDPSAESDGSAMPDADGGSPDMGQPAPTPEQEPTEPQPMQENVKKRINELFQNINKDERDEKKDDRTDITTRKTGPVGYKRSAKLPKDLKK